MHQLFGYFAIKLILTPYIKLWKLMFGKVVNTHLEWDTVSRLDHLHNTKSEVFRVTVFQYQTVFLCRVVKETGN